MAGFEDCWKRIRRADDHRAAFISGWESIAKSDFYDLLPEDQGNGAGVIRSFLKTPFNNDLPLVLGEFFYQLRASLDAAVYRAASLQHSDPPPSPGTLQFPICKKRSCFESRQNWISPLSNDLKEWIEAVQPYNSARFASTQTPWLNRSLDLLEDCARKDRHRQLHLVGALVSNHEVTIAVSPPTRITYMRAIPGDILKDRCVIFEFGIDGPRCTYVKTTGDFSIDISVKEIPNVTGPALNVELVRVSLAVQRVIKEFDQIVNSLE